MPRALFLYVLKNMIDTQRLPLGKGAPAGAGEELHKRSAATNLKIIQLTKALIAALTTGDAASIP